MADSSDPGKKDGKVLEEDVALFRSLFGPEDSADSGELIDPPQEYDLLTTSCAVPDSGETLEVPDVDSPPSPQTEARWKNLVIPPGFVLDSNASVEAESGTSSPTSTGCVIGDYKDDLWDDDPSFPSGVFHSLTDRQKHAGDRRKRISSFWLEIVPTGMGAGLTNLGNTCFVNSILQCLTHTVPLVMALRTHNHSLPSERGSDGFCIHDALHGHIEHSLAFSGDTIDSEYLFNNLRRISPSLQRHRQEDAHEFLHVLLDKLSKCCLNQNPSEISSSSEVDNIVQQVFGGRSISQLKCCSCGHLSETYEPLIDLSLEIENADTLNDMLQSYTQVERLEDPETRFTCGNCKDRVITEKQLKLDLTPSVTMLHLKRFKTNGSSVEKIDKHVRFPLELDLTPYCSHGQDDHVDLRYQLYGMVVHMGPSPAFGHYICYIRSSPGKWHELNDVKVTERGEEAVLSQTAYILLYAREGTPWFSSLMDQREDDQDLGGSSMPQKSVLQTLHTEHTTCDLNENDKEDCDAGLTRAADAVKESVTNSPRESVQEQVENHELVDGFNEGLNSCDNETEVAQVQHTGGADNDPLEATEPPCTYDQENDIDDDGLPLKLFKWDS